MITETRRAPRMPVPDMVPVRDLMTETVIGQLSNISESGMLLLVSAQLTDDALYQLQFTIPDGRGAFQNIDAGVHLLWREPAHAPDQHWVGFRFLTMDKAQREQLVKWIESRLPTS